MHCAKRTRKITQENGFFLPMGEFLAQLKTLLTHEEQEKKNKMNWGETNSNNKPDQFNSYIIPLSVVTLMHI